MAVAQTRSMANESTILHSPFCDESPAESAPQVVSEVQRNSKKSSISCNFPSPEISNVAPPSRALLQTLATGKACCPALLRVKYEELPSDQNNRNLSISGF